MFKFETPEVIDYHVDDNETLHRVAHRICEIADRDHLPVSFERLGVIGVAMPGDCPDKIIHEWLTDIHALHSAGKGVSS